MSNLGILLLTYYLCLATPVTLMTTPITDVNTIGNEIISEFQLYVHIEEMEYIMFYEPPVVIASVW